MFSMFNVVCTLTRWSVLGLIAGALSYGCASVALPAPSTTANTPAPVVPAWTVIDQGHYREYRYTTPVGNLGIMCDADSCVGAFLEPTTGCVVDARYPVLLNTAKRVGVLPAACKIMRDVDNDNRQIVVLSGSPQSLVEELFKRDVHLAFPRQKGTIVVFKVPTDGVSKLLGENVKNPFLPSSKRPSSKHGTDLSASL